MKSDEIRQKYLEFFKQRGHAIVPSASLVPENDPTTLFTGSGMQPMLPYFLGKPHPLGTRIVDSQKSFRSQDIEEVGDNRHTTFFEMLGNWSFGDYFKEEQIPWMFEFLTKEIGLDPKNLYFTCFRGNDSLGIPRDTISAGIWQKLLKDAGVSNEIQDFPERDGMKGGARIFYYDEKKNWWSRSGVPKNMPEGEPGGPDTEMFWDFGANLNLHENSQWKDEPCHVNCDCGRFMEIGNNVFMEYIKTASGFEKLPKPNVDFGGGLERIEAALRNDSDVFNTSLFKPLFDYLETNYNASYKKVSGEERRILRIVADHLRAAVFLIHDGVLPANTDHGYVLRRLLRRAIRYANYFKINLAELATYIESAYPASSYVSLSNPKNDPTKVIKEEEDKFRETLEKGMKQFRRLEGKEISGKDAFDLYQTYGFPFELTVELATEEGKKIDEDGFKKEMEQHQALSRSGSEQKFKGGLADHGEMSVKYHTATHLLHKALRDVLGGDVYQKGSNITPERLRFDFSFPRKMTDEEKKRVEDLVNEQIKRALPVSYEDLPLEEAKKRGAIGLFEEKYGDVVRVYKIGDYSLEFCGGPHVENTSKLGVFKIAKEEALAQGVRRIKAVLS